MIQQSVDRSAQTKKSLVTSFGVHALLLLLLVFYVGRQATRVEADELTEIAYIEAHYGEDVAAKVRMKKLPQRTDPGRGVSTDSAMKPKNPSPDPPRPKMQDAVAPDIERKATESMLAEAPKLDSKSYREASRPVVDTSRLTARTLESASSTAPTAKGLEPSAFTPSTSSLQQRSNKIILSDKSVPQSSGKRGGVADAPATLGGGGLKGGKSSGGSYQPPSAALKGKGSGGSKAVLDVEGPSGSGGSGSKGRKTMLDYGSGSGQGGLRGGKSGLAEAPSTKIVKKSSGSSKSTVTDVKMDGKGVSMTISGEIKGRKILKSVAPIYTTKAKKNGWEGAVAVHFTVLADGRVKDNIYFEQSSMHRDLNKAARDAIKQFLFAPLPQGQSTVEQWGVITIVFRLN